MPVLDQPNKVVNSILWSSRHRRKEVPVGWKAKTSWTMHHAAQHFTEWFSAQGAYHYQIKTAPPAPATQGTLYKPIESGRGIDDGVKRRIKEEKRQRKHARK